MTARGGYAGTPKPPLTAGREFAGVDPRDAASWDTRSGPPSPSKLLPIVRCFGLSLRNGPPSRPLHFR